MIVTVDLETLPGIRAVDATEADWRAQALDPYQGLILCIGAAVDDDEPRVFMSDGPRPAFDALAAYLDERCERQRPVWVGHAIGTFDIRWLYLHACAMRHPIARRIPWGKWSKDIVDTKDLAMGPNPAGKPPKLDALARMLGVPSKTEGMDGSQVLDLFLAGRLDEIAAYCAQDVRVTRDVYRVLTGDWR